LKIRFLLIFFFLFFGTFYPQETDSLNEIKEIRYDETPKLSPTEFDKEKIEKFQSQEEFSYLHTVVEENWWTRFKTWLNLKYNQFLSWLFQDYQASGLLSAIIAIIPALFIFIILGLIFWLFSRLNYGGKMLQKPKTSEVFLSEEEELVKNEDLDTLIQKAVQTGKFRLAVRYYYLKELRKLDELEFIEYEYQKTNRDYSNEIESAAIRKQFANISMLYEFIWYGSFQVSETDFKLAEKGFLKMEDSLKDLKHA